MTTYSRRGLHGSIVNELGRRIMRGELQPGQMIDPESLLVEMDVSRTVMREAIKVLSAKGLVDARPRFGTFVTERSRWQLLDVDVMNWRAMGEPDPRLVLELGEVRQIIEPAAARMAATRHTAEQLARLQEACDALEATAALDQPSVQADVAFHNAILAAAGNELLERFEVVLEPALHARDALAFQHKQGSDWVNAHRRVFEAIAARDAELAFQRMSELTDTAMSDSEAILKRS